MESINTYEYLERLLIEKIRSLPPEKVAEVVNFVDFLYQRDENIRLAQASLKLSAKAFQVEIEDVIVWKLPSY